MMHRQVTRRSPCAAATDRKATRSLNRPSSLSLSSSSSNISQSTFKPTLITRPTNNNNNTTNNPIISSNSSSSSNHSSSSNLSSSTSSSLLSVLAWSMTLLLVSSCLGIADAGTLMGHPFSKRSFMDIQCKGVYDKSLFARLDRICEDCYNLFREPQLHTLCRKNCFTSDYFKGCLDVLLLQDEMEWIQTSIKQLHGADPGV